MGHDFSRETLILGEIHSRHQSSDGEELRRQSGGLRNDMRTPDRNAVEEVRGISPDKRANVRQSDLGAGLSP